MVCDRPSPSIRRNRICDDQGYVGGGIPLRHAGLALIADNVICRNQAERGAAIAMNGGAADLIGNVIDSDRATSIAGGLYCSSEPPHSITDNLFRSNYTCLGIGEAGADIGASGVGCTGP